MAEEDNKKTRRLEATGHSEPEPTIASTRADGTSGSTARERGSSTEVNQPADRFTLTQVLGEGTQGEVCKAFDNLLQRHVAIKFPHRVDDDRVAQDILQEARKAARLNHANVVTIYEVGFWKGRPFIAMELVEGVSLATILKECGRISVDRYLKYAKQILRALGAAHRSGLIHRDLKPHNVLMSGEGVLKLTDFGVAHVGSGIGADKTVQFKIAGTPAYMAPEQWSGLTPDARSDIYAFGCMSYKLLSGQSVFPAEETMRHHLDSKPKPIRSLAPQVPESLERIIMRCLEKKPEQRYQSCKELSDAIELASRSNTEAGTATWPKNQEKSKSKLVLFSIIALLASAGGLIFGTPLGEPIRGQLFGEAKQKQPTDEPKSDGSSGTTGAALEADRDQAAVLRQQAEGREALEDAKKDGISLDDRIRLGNLALAKLEGLPEAEDARSLVNAALSEKQALKARVTENMIVEAFNELLDKARSELDADQLDDAYMSLMKAEEKKNEEPVLRKSAKEINLIKLPLVNRLADRAALSGRFMEAASYFDEAANIADQIGRAVPRDALRQDQQTCKNLDRLSRTSSEQPRLVVMSFDSMNGELSRFPAAHLSQARAWLSLGGYDECRRALDALMASQVDAEVKASAQSLRGFLPK